MTTSPTTGSTRPSPRRGTIVLPVEGDLDHETCDDLLDAVAEALRGRPDATELRLDCSGLTMCDSMGLAALLMVRRRTDAAGVQLTLDARPAFLDRLLTITGTADNLLRRLPADGTDRADRADQADRADRADRAGGEADRADSSG